MKNNAVEFAQVTSFNKDFGWGLAETENGDIVHFRMNVCRRIRSEPDPFFTGENYWNQPEPRNGENPGSMIVLVRNSKVKPGSKYPTTQVWGYAIFWKEHCRQENLSVTEPIDLAKESEEQELLRRGRDQARLDSFNRRWKTLAQPTIPVRRPAPSTTIPTAMVPHKEPVRKEFKDPSKLELVIQEHVKETECEKQVRREMNIYAALATITA